MAHQDCRDEVRPGVLIPSTREHKSLNRGGCDQDEVQTGLPAAQGLLSAVQRVSVVCLGLVMLVMAVRQPVRSQPQSDPLLMAGHSQVTADYLDKVA